ncbi:MAG: exodeoxyribonuclease VII small subunit [Mycobacterium sp.]
MSGSDADRDGDGGGALSPRGSGITGESELSGLTYEELVANLEDLTARMSSPEVGIEEAADLYEQARLVHRAASERLERVRSRIDRLADAPSQESQEAQESRED